LNLPIIQTYDDYLEQQSRDFEQEEQQKREKADMAYDQHKDLEDERKYGTH
jgi:hypothetical protein